MAILVIVVCSIANVRLRYDGSRYIRRIDDASFGWPGTHYRGNLHHKRNVEFNIIVLSSNIIFVASLAALVASISSMLANRRWTLSRLLRILLIVALLLSSWRLGKMCEPTGEPLPDPEMPASR